MWITTFWASGLRLSPSFILSQAMLLATCPMSRPDSLACMVPGFFQFQRSPQSIVPSIPGEPARECHSAEKPAKSRSIEKPWSASPRKAGWESPWVSLECTQTSPERLPPSGASSQSAFRETRRRKSQYSKLKVRYQLRYHIIKMVLVS